MLHCLFSVLSPQFQVPNYVDTTHNVFVCTSCSGLHRELQYKIKGISLSNFTEEEVAAIASMGNTKFNEVYLSRFGDQSVPNTTDQAKFKEFIRHKYVDKRWHADHGIGPAAAVPVSNTKSFSSESRSGFDKPTVVEVKPTSSSLKPFPTSQSV